MTEPLAPTLPVACPNRLLSRSRAATHRLAYEQATRSIDQQLEQVEQLRAA